MKKNINDVEVNDGQAKWRRRQSLCPVKRRYFFKQTIVKKYMKSIYSINAEAITLHNVLTKTFFKILTLSTKRLQCPIYLILLVNALG